MTPLLVAAIGAGIKAITFYGGAKAGMRTMLDALIPAHTAASTCIDTLASAADDAKANAGGVAVNSSSAVVQALADGARLGAESTKTMEAVAGRASYVPAEKLRGVPDPGAMALALAFAAIAQSVAQQ